MTILEMSFTGGILIAAILLLRRCALFRLPKWTFLLLWGAALCRLLIPFSLPSPFSLYTGAEALAQAVESAQKIPLTPPLPQPESHPDEPPVVILPLAPQEKETAPARPAAPEPEKTVLPPLTALYLTGAGLCALWFAAAYLHCLLAFRNSQPADCPALDRWQSTHPRPRVRFRQSRAVSAPLTYGLLRPT
ncbi:M56 family metallopeptidase, partial [Oscillospiraceae bacterium 50-16]